MNTKFCHAVRLLTLTVVLMTLAGCTLTWGRRPPDDGGPKIDGEELTRAIVEYCVDLHHDKNLFLEDAVAFFGARNESVMKIRIKFSSQDLVELKEAREVLVDVVQGLVQKLNAETYVGFEPISDENIECYITYESYLGLYVDKTYVHWTVLQDSMAYFYAFDETNEFYFWDRDSECWHHRVEPFYKTVQYVMYGRAAEADWRRRHPKKELSNELFYSSGTELGGKESVQQQLNQQELQDKESTEPYLFSNPYEQTQQQVQQPQQAMQTQQPEQSNDGSILRRSSNGGGQYSSMNQGNGNSERAAKTAEDESNSGPIIQRPSNGGGQYSSTNQGNQVNTFNQGNPTNANAGRGYNNQGYQQPANQGYQQQPANYQYPPGYQPEYIQSYYPMDGYGAPQSYDGQMMPSEYDSQGYYPDRNQQNYYQDTYYEPRSPWDNQPYQYLDFPTETPFSNTPSYGEPAATEEYLPQSYTSSDYEPYGYENSYPYPAAPSDSNRKGADYPGPYQSTRCYNVPSNQGQMNQRQQMQPQQQQQQRQQQTYDPNGIYPPSMPL